MGGGEGCHHEWVAAMLVLQWRSCDCSRQAGKLRVRTEHLEVCRHFRAGISINVYHLCQYAFYRRSACITGVPGRSGEGTAGRRRSMLRIAELNTWRSARKHADPKPIRGGVATVRGQRGACRSHRCSLRVRDRFLRETYHGTCLRWGLCVRRHRRSRRRWLGVCQAGFLENGNLWLFVRLEWQLRHEYQHPRARHRESQGRVSSIGRNLTKSMRYLEYAYHFWIWNSGR